MSALTANFHPRLFQWSRFSCSYAAESDLMHISQSPGPRVS